MSEVLSWLPKPALYRGSVRQTTSKTEKVFRYIAHCSCPLDIYAVFGRENL